MGGIGPGIPDLAPVEGLPLYRDAQDLPPARLKPFFCGSEHPGVNALGLDGRQAPAAGVTRLGQQVPGLIGIVGQADPGRVAGHPRRHEPTRRGDIVAVQGAVGQRVPVQRQGQRPAHARIVKRRPAGIEGQVDRPQPRPRDVLCGVPLLRTGSRVERAKKPEVNHVQQIGLVHLQERAGLQAAVKLDVLHVAGELAVVAIIAHQLPHPLGIRVFQAEGAAGNQVLRLGPGGAVLCQGVARNGTGAAQGQELGKIADGIFQLHDEDSVVGRAHAHLVRIPHYARVKCPRPLEILPERGID